MILFNKIPQIILLLFLILYFLPWWVGVIFCLIIGFFSDNIKSAIQITSSALTISWGIILTYRWIIGGEILMERVANMLHLNNSFMLAGLILIIPLILGGLSGLTGKLIHDALN